MIKRGFTLIELLIVISIIGILAALATFSFTSAQKQARDTNRKSDLTQYRTALEAFANKNDGLYPSRTGRVNPSSAAFCTKLGLGTSCPDDPKKDNDSSFYYSYISDGTNGSDDATNFVLWAKIENVTTGGTNNWVVCSNGKSGKYTGTPTTGVCPI